MGVLRNIRMARTAQKLGNQFEVLWDSPDAYRPPAEILDPPRRIPGVLAMHLVADHANAIGATSGDSGVLGVALMSAIDELQSYGAARDLVLDELLAGRIRSVAGPPMRQFLSAPTALSIIEVIGSQARLEAYVEHANER